MQRYPRNMQGYGGRPPFADWPGGANIAVQFVLNYEEGGENCLLHGDAASEGFLSEIPGAQPWPGMRHWNMESVYEYGARAGFWRLRDLFVSRGVPVTIYGVASALARSPAQVAAMQEAGWEIASHGLKWIDYRDFTREAEEAGHARGDPPPHRGRRRGAARLVHRPHLDPHRRRSPARRGSSTTSPTPTTTTCPTGSSTRAASSSSSPTASSPTTCASRRGRFTTSEDYFTYLKDTFDVLYAEGAAGSPKMFSVGLHCRLVGRPGRIAGLARFIDYVLKHDRVWTPTRLDIARHWRARHPAPAAGAAADDARPGRTSSPPTAASTSTRPWIAERAFAPRARAGARHRRRPRQRARPRLPLGVARRSGSACSPPTPTSPASSPRRSA